MGRDLTRNMADETDLEELKRGTELVKRGFARMQQGGVIMDVVNAEQARIAEDAGAVAVMALEAVPADIRKRGGVARMADPADITEIIEEVSIPVMGKSRIGHLQHHQRPKRARGRRPPWILDWLPRLRRHLCQRRRPKPRTLRGRHL